MTSHSTTHDHDHSHDFLHDHDHEHDHTHDAEHDHDHPGGVIGWLMHTFGFGGHSHSHHDAANDPALATAKGISAVKISLAILLLTAVLQILIVAISGSVALLADTIHNFSDGLTALPLWLAFTLSIRPRNQRYTYGYGRAEDLAGALIVLMIFASAVVVFYESILKIIHPEPLQNLGWVAAAAVIGFLGNEAVALFRIRVGRQINSAALIADGRHSRADGFTSLGVLVGAIGVWLGFPLADPLIGFAIGVAILVIVWSSAKDMWVRMMDATEPEIPAEIDHQAHHVEGVLGVHDIGVRWVGHSRRAELHITVNCQLTTLESHRIAEEVRHRLFHAIPALREITVHVDPCECEEGVVYHPTAHHMQPG